MAMPNRQWQPDNEDRTAEPASLMRVLAIDEVRVTGDQVTGRMAPYADPETGETLSTTFEGRVKGDVISGTLSTVHAKSGVRDDGTWKVTRSAP
jgi:hypothetical protein